MLNVLLFITMFFGVTTAIGFIMFHYASAADSADRAPATSDDLI